jgi:serine/threonine protein kinase/WD40 repeat protein
MLSAASPGKSRSVDPSHSQRGGIKAGEYTLGSRLGEGGFSDVYAAHGGSGAPVAVKLIKKGMDSEEVAARFRAEQRVLHTLHHPGIVQIFDSGMTDDGRAYFVMEQVDGLCITEFCKAGRLLLHQRLLLFVEVCEAIQHAHRRGVLHRDLKPTNILVTDEGRPKIIDFGIAKAIDSMGTGDTQVTKLGQVLGTPSYMSPEQAAGGYDFDTRSDVYALGTVLYEMITERPPHDPMLFQNLAPVSWAEYLKENEPLLPSVAVGTQTDSDSPIAARQLRGDIDTIVSKAMAREPHRRYPTVEAMAEDIRRWMDGREVLARSPSLIYQLRRIVSRHRWKSAAAFAVLAAIAASAIAGVIIAIESRKAERTAQIERDRAITAEKNATAATLRAEHAAYQSAIQLARAYIQNQEPFLAYEHLGATPKHLRGWEWGFLMNAVPQPDWAVETGMAHALLVAASPDGRVAAVSEDDSIRIYAMDTGAEIARFKRPGSVVKMAISKDGKWVAAVSNQRENWVLWASAIDSSASWNLDVFESPDLEWEPESTGGALLFVCGDSPLGERGWMARFEKKTGRLLNERRFARQNLASGRALAIHPDGMKAMVRVKFSAIALVELPSLEPIGKPFRQSVIAQDFMFHPKSDTRLFAVGIEVWKIGDDTPEEGVRVVDLGDSSLASSAESIERLSLNSDGRWFAASKSLVSVEGAPPKRRPVATEVQSLNLENGRSIVLLQRGRVEVRSSLPSGTNYVPNEAFSSETIEGRRLVFSPDGSRVYWQTWERNSLLQLAVNRPDDCTAVTLPKRSEERSNLPAVHPDGSIIFAIGSHLCVAQQLTGELTQKHLFTEEETWSAQVTEDGSRVAIGYKSGARILAWNTHETLQKWNLPNGPFTVYATADNNSFLAFGTDGSLHRLTVGNPVAEPCMLVETHGLVSPSESAYHKDSGHFAVASARGFHIYDLSSRHPVLLKNIKLESSITALAFDPSGKRIAAAIETGEIVLWDWEYSMPLLAFPTRSKCRGIAFSKDGEWMGNTDFAPNLVLRRSPTRFRD